MEPEDCKRRQRVHHRPLPGDLLRHFDFGKGQLAGYLPRSTFPDRSSYSSLTEMRCSSKEVAIFSRPEKTYILMPYEGKLPRVYDASAPAGLSLTGFAILGPGNAYLVLINREGPTTPRKGSIRCNWTRQQRLVACRKRRGTSNKPGHGDKTLGYRWRIPGVGSRPGSCRDNSGSQGDA
jgi:hypothetical protein